uniref:RxLR effector protein n=1 Tax=Phytophthora sojae TaxID=67593 RepID=G1FT75_PHYSO|nr:Avh429 [Phytophthora sojae]
MRRGFFAVRVAVTVLTVASAATKDSNPSTSVRSLTDTPDGVSTKRLLSSNKAVDESEKERAIAIPGLAKIKEWITANVSRFKTWYSNWLNEGGEDTRRRFQAAEGGEDTRQRFQAAQAGSRPGNGAQQPEANFVGWVPYQVHHEEPWEKDNCARPVAKSLETARLNPKGPTFRLADTLQAHELVVWRRMACRRAWYSTC